MSSNDSGIEYLSGRPSTTARPVLTLGMLPLDILAKCDSLAIAAKTTSCAKRGRAPGQEEGSSDQAEERDFANDSTERRNKRPPVTRTHPAEFIDLRTSYHQLDIWILA